MRLAVAALALACALVVPLRLSADVQAYAAYGALIDHGRDPWAHAYRVGEIAPLHDPLLDAALRAWNGSIPRNVYGPLFTLPCAVVVAAARGLGPSGVVVVLRVLAAAALLVCIGIASRTRPRLATLLAFHPVVLWTAAEGHNDTFWLALVLVGERVRASGVQLATLVAAAAVKAIAIVPLAWAIAHRPPRRRFFEGALCAAALAAAYSPLIASVIERGFDRNNGPPRLSLVHAPSLSVWSNSPEPLALALVLAVIGAFALVRAIRRDDLVAGATLLGWIALPAPEPWYALWLVPVIAAVRPSPAAYGLAAATVTGLVAYAQDVVPGTVLRDPAFLGGTMLALYALPLVIAAISPAPSPGPIVPPTPPPLASPSPLPQPTSTSTPTPAASPSGAPSPSATPSPSIAPTAPPSPTPVPSASPVMFGYVVAPQPIPSSVPRIVEVALNDKVLHRGGMLLVRITASPDVTSMVARTMGHEIGIPLLSPGVFAGQQQLPGGIPFFLLNRTYQIEFIGSTVDGKTASFTLPVRLER